MVDRIRTLLASRQLSPTQFADAIGVARPIVSHILSGRNKPSLEVVQRILTAMPDLSMPWLLNGTGAMLAAAPPSPVLPAAVPGLLQTGPQAAPAPTAIASTEEPAPKAAPTGFSGPARPAPAAAAHRPAARLSPSGHGAPGVPSAPQPRRFPGARVAAATPPQPGAAAIVEAPGADAVGRAEPGAAPAVAASTPGNEPEPVVSPLTAEVPAQALRAGGEKAVRRIVIFYRDGSFTDYRPE